MLILINVLFHAKLDFMVTCKCLNAYNAMQIALLAQMLKPAVIVNLAFICIQIKLANNAMQTAKNA